MRKAQITINMTWLFAILAGIAVFTLIISFSGDVQEQGEAETSITVLQNFESQMTSLSNTRNTFDPISLPEDNLQVLCSGWQSSALRLGDSPDSTPTPYQPIFSYEELEGGEVLSWTKDWYVPTKIDRFLYLSSPNTLFIVVRDSEEMYQDFVDALPDGFPTGVVSYANISEYGNRAYDNYRFIFFNENQGDITSISQLPIGGDITAVNIKPKNGYGTVEFYRMEVSFVGPTKARYVGDALKYGAVFSEDVQHYSCNREKALYKLRTQAETNLDRASQIFNELAGNQSECRNVATIGPQCDECLRIMKTLPAEYDDLKTAAEGGLSLSQAEKIYNASRNIKSITEGLRRGSDCPTQ